MQEWRDYFIFTGSIGATLLGLLFVAISLNAETILSGTHRHLKELAGQTFQNFLLIVVVSLFFLFPRIKFESFGVLGLYGVAWVAYRLYIVLQISWKDYHWVRVVRRLLPAGIACSCMIYAGFWVKHDDVASALVAVGMASALLLVSAAVSSWELLVRVAEYRQHR